MRVNVDDQAINEPRIRRMARRLGQQHGRYLHHSEVLGRLIMVWMLCYSRRSPSLRLDDIDITADLDGFADAMLAEEMADAIQGDGPAYVRVRGVTERIAFLERQSERGRKGGKVAGKGPNQTAQARLFADDEALAKRVHERTLARAQAQAERRPSERLRSPQAYSPDQDLDQALDQDLDHRVPRVTGDERQTGLVLDQDKPGKPTESAQDARKGEGPTGPADEPERAAKGKPARDLPDQAYTLSHLLLGMIKTNHPTGRIAKAPERVQSATALRWADPIDKLQRIDGFTWGEIEGMIVWCQRDSFWRTVILGADNLRDKWDQMAAQRGRSRGGGTYPQRKGPTELALEEVRELEAMEQAQERAREQASE